MYYTVLSILHVQCTCNTCSTVQYISILVFMDYSPWGSKNLIEWNRFKKFMQLGVDVTCMYANFGGCGFSGFGDTATLKNGQISLSGHGL